MSCKSVGKIYIYIYISIYTVCRYISLGNCIIQSFFSDKACHLERCFWQVDKNVEN